MGIKESKYICIKMTIGYSNRNFVFCSTVTVMIAVYEKMADMVAHRIAIPSKIVPNHIGGRRNKIIAAKGKMGVKEYPSKAT
jgi:hypothetical protein